MWRKRRTEKYVSFLGGLKMNTNIYVCFWACVRAVTWATVWTKQTHQGRLWFQWARPQCAETFTALHRLKNINTCIYIYLCFPWFLHTELLFEMHAFSVDVQFALTLGRRQSSRSSWCRGRPLSCLKWVGSGGQLRRSHSETPGPQRARCQCSVHTRWRSLDGCHTCEEDRIS